MIILGAPLLERRPHHVTGRRSTANGPIVEVAAYLCLSGVVVGGTAGCGVTELDVVATNRHAGVQVARSCS